MSEEATEEVRAKFEAAEAELLREISKDSRILSLLYDLDLLPEQLNRGTRDWRRMLLITEHVKHWNAHIPLDSNQNERRP